jgi:hypothetical protein
MARTKSGEFVKIETGSLKNIMESWISGVMEKFDCGFRISDFGFKIITCE